MDYSNFTVVVPVYNEEKGVTAMAEEVNKFLPTAKILVVNDGSTDKTFDILKKLQKKYRNLSVISYPKNKGYGAALKAGSQNVKTPYFGYIDADRTYHPKEFSPMLQLLLDNNLDVVFGNRFTPGNGMPRLRLIGNFFLVLLFRIVNFPRGILDVTCGQMVLRKDCVHKLDIPTIADGFEFITQIAKRIVSRRLKYRVYNIVYRTREGSSKLRIFRDFIHMAKQIIIAR